MDFNQGSGSQYGEVDGRTAAATLTPKPRNRFAFYHKLTTEVTSSKPLGLVQWRVLQAYFTIRVKFR
ncbi:unnamed protein product, partial [Nesidiocoris tenuis]